jgi:hypothetical protein
MEPLTKVNSEQCSLVAKAIKPFHVRPEFYNREFIRFEADRETKLRIYFLSTAICHQTHNLHHTGLNLWGWDYIEYAFLSMFKKKHPMLNPGYVSICSNCDMGLYLSDVFSENGKGGNTTLDRIEERAEMLLEICRVVRTNYNRNIAELIDGCEGKLINNGKGLYEILPQFTAFSDPLKKKITFFLKLASDAGLIRIKDPENLVPIMDYHMQRVLLRTGCVEIIDKELKKNITGRNRINSDEEIRKSCIDAIKLIAQDSGHELTKMNDFFWPLGRSCCNETLLCQIRTCSKNPCSLEQVITLDLHEECLLEKSCKGAANAEYRSLWEPEVNTHYY